MHLLDMKSDWENDLFLINCLFKRILFFSLILFKLKENWISYETHQILFDGLLTCNKNSSIMSDMITRLGNITLFFFFPFDCSKIASRSSVLFRLKQISAVAAYKGLMYPGVSLCLASNCKFNICATWSYSHYLC